jgi:hypothetical protein
MMEYFKLIPENVAIQKLAKCKESIRFGDAIGLAGHIGLDRVLALRMLEEAGAVNTESNKIG